jgi:uncharacterized membrane protein YdjX (TVP38/TMEM64 family)
LKALASIAAALMIVFVLLYAGAEKAGWTDEARISQWFDHVRASRGGAAASAALIASLLTLDLVLPVPSSIVMTLSGALLGWPAGMAVCFAGAMGSALLGFGLCRRFGRPAFERVVGAADAARVERLFEDWGVWGILMSRSVPMLTEIVSCAAGLSRLPLRAFLALTVAGTLPLCAVYAWAGNRSLQAGAGWAVLLAFLAPAAGFALLRWRRARLSS